jgi:hypothetical protein
MKKSLTSVILIFASILTLLLGGLYYYMYSKLLDNNGQVVALADETAKESADEDTTRALRTAIQSTNNERTLLHSLFLGKDDTASLIEKLEGLAALSHVTHELSVDTKSDAGLLADDKEILLTTIKVSGSWIEVHRFLGLVENLPYKVTLTNVRLNKGEVVDAKTKGLAWSAIISAQFIKEK